MTSTNISSPDGHNFYNVTAESCAGKYEDFAFRPDTRKWFLILIMMIGDLADLIAIISTLEIFRRIIKWARGLMRRFNSTFAGLKKGIWFIQNFFANIIKGNETLFRAVRRLQLKPVAVLIQFMNLKVN